MSRRLTKRDLRSLDEDEYGATSRVYRHIRDNYVDLTGRQVGLSGGPSWETVAQMLTRRGQTNGKGQPLTAETVRKLFGRVKSDLKNRPLPTGPVSTQHPSRQRADWEPPLAASQPQPVARRVPAPQTRNAATPPAKALPQAGDAGVEAKLAAVKRQFAYLDRHIVQQPDED